MELHLDGLASLDRLRRRLEQAPRIASEELRRGMESAVQVTAESVREVTPVDTGTLQRGIVGAVTRIGTDQLQGEVRVIGPGREYAAFVNDGTRPHEIRAKRGKALKFQIGSRTLFRPKVRHPGNAPVRFMERGMQAARPKVLRIFSARLGQVTRRLRG